ncbi:hypothetical protein FDUTEX481_02007 [Tolypothrix sp. PCC 7601]|nr:hypothetical protein FDUTEX481_02007 [Tolypothrix sp. PCC 7601]
MRGKGGSGNIIQNSKCKTKIIYFEFLVLNLGFPNPPWGFKPQAPSNLSIPLL